MEEEEETLLHGVTFGGSLSSGHVFLFWGCLFCLALFSLLLVAVFSSGWFLQLPGTAVVPLILFASTPAIPNGVQTKAFQVEDDVINAIKSKFGS
ncbi:hypothetical protein QYF36_019005 [Acer negundo]|nr:hypothetical protein QYF36_019005 [Acer negundo]